MNFWRAILASLLSLVCTLAVSAFVTLQTLQATVLDREQVKAWLDKSGVYGNLLTTTLDSNTAAGQQLDTGTSSGSIVSADDLRAALNQTFDAAYVRQAAEKAIDGGYNWLEGKSSDISFEINTTTKKADFIARLSAVLEPQLAQLPQCMSLAQFQSNNPPCLPAGTSPKQAADQLATDAANRADIFQEPVTDTTVADTSTKSQATSLTANPTAQQARQIVKDIRLWLLWLPIIALVGGGLTVLLSEHKLKAAKHLSGRLTAGLFITCGVGLLVSQLGRTFSASSQATGAAATALKQIVEPVVHQAAPAIGNRLALVSGLLGMMTLVLWITLRTIKKKRGKAELLTAPDEAKTKVAASKPAVSQAPPTPGDDSKKS